MIPPTTDNLKALAGWAISEVSRASPAQELALHKLRDGCAGLIENPLPAVQPVAEKVRPRSTARTVTVSPSQPSSQRLNIQKSQMPVVGQLSCQAGGDHRFDIKTQRCVWCGGTYRKLKSRDPEFMK